MTEMTSHERFMRMYEHREADHVPILDSPWGATIERWQKEGMPRGADWVDFFGIDKTAMIWTDNSHRYEGKVIEETPDYRVSTTNWGVTLRNWTHAASTPEFLQTALSCTAATGRMETGGTVHSPVHANASCNVRGS
jgi:uroporphyrinogen decarboxylase